MCFSKWSKIFPQSSPSRPQSVMLKNCFLEYPEFFTYYICSSLSPIAIYACIMFHCALYCSLSILVCECSIKISQSTRNNKLRLFLLTHKRSECCNQCMLKKLHQCMQQDRTIVICQLTSIHPTCTVWINSWICMVHYHKKTILVSFAISKMLSKLAFLAIYSTCMYEYSYVLKLRRFHYRGYPRFIIIFSLRSCSIYIAIYS